ncbi:MAG: hypothetical protein AAF609_16670 [Cyanobacteria bacterium P01_C01_bin.120]
MIARALLEGTIQNELTTILTLTATSIPDELPLGEDPYDPSQMEEAYRTMTDPDWRQALRHHYRLGLWGMRVILMHNWKGQRCRELSMGTRYSLQVQMPSIAEAILQGRSKPFSPQPAVSLGEVSEKKLALKRIPPPELNFMAYSGF